MTIILAKTQMDKATLCAGLLHDTVEDTALTFDEVQSLFGPTVRKIVEGETKVSKLPKMVRAQIDEPAEVELDMRTKAEEQVENLRSMFIAMAEDWRIVVVKLADRLHNMRTLQYMPVEKRVRIARETLEIFAPLAHRLGMWTYKTELADLSFKYTRPAQLWRNFAQFSGAILRNSPTRLSTLDRYIFPREFLEIDRTINSKLLVYQDVLESAKAQVEELLQADEWLYGRVRSVGVTGRTKSIYSTWKKMQRHEYGIERINDLVALRVVLYPEVPEGEEQLAEGDENALCFHVLGKVHSRWTPLPRTLKDYISSAEAQRLPLAAHHRPRRHAAPRGADPHRADAHGRRVRRGGALGVQGGAGLGVAAVAADHPRLGRQRRGHQRVCAARPPGAPRHPRLHLLAQRPHPQPGEGSDARRRRLAAHRPPRRAAHAPGPRQRRAGVGGLRAAQRRHRRHRRRCAAPRRGGGRISAGARARYVAEQEEMRLASAADTTGTAPRVWKVCGACLPLPATPSSALWTAGSSRGPCTAPAATAASSHGSSAADAPSPPERTPGATPAPPAPPVPPAPPRRRPPPPAVTTALRIPSDGSPTADHKIYRCLSARARARALPFRAADRRARPPPTAAPAPPSLARSVALEQALLDAVSSSTNEQGLVSQIVVFCRDRRGMLLDVSTAVTDEAENIIDVHSETLDASGGGEAAFQYSVHVRDAAQLDALQRAVQKVDSVVHVARGNMAEMQRTRGKTAFWSLCRRSEFSRREAAARSGVSLVYTPMI